MTQSILNKIFTALPPLTTSQQRLLAFGAAALTYRIALEILRKRSHSATIALLGVALLCNTSSSLVVYLCFTVAVVIAVMLHPGQPVAQHPRFALTRPPHPDQLPPGLIDMLSEADSHPEWEYGPDPNNLLVPLVRALADGWSRYPVLRGNTTDARMMLESLAWCIKNKKVPVSLENLRIVKFDLHPSTDPRTEKQLSEIAGNISKYLSNHLETICIFYSSHRTLLEPDELRKATLTIQRAVLNQRRTNGKRLRLILTIPEKKSENLNVDDCTLLEVTRFTTHPCIHRLEAIRSRIESGYPGIKIDSDAITAAVLVAHYYTTSRSQHSSEKVHHAGQLMKTHNPIQQGSYNEPSNIYDQSLYTLAYDLIMDVCANALINAEGQEHTLTYTDVITWTEKSKKIPEHDLKGIISEISNHNVC